jgi:hypothetical protein
MPLRIQQHLTLPVITFTHAGRVTVDEIWEGCVALTQLYKYGTYTFVIDLTEMMYTWDLNAFQAQDQMVEAVAHPNVRQIIYVFPGANLHPLALAVKAGYMVNRLAHKARFVDTVEDAYTQVEQEIMRGSRTDLDTLPDVKPDERGQP